MSSKPLGLSGSPRCRWGIGRLVQQDVDVDTGADRKGRLMNPLPGQRCHCPRADEHVAVDVGEDAEGAAGFLFIRPWPGNHLGQINLGNRRAQTLLIGLGQSDARSGDLGVCEDNAGPPVRLC